MQWHIAWLGQQNTLSNMQGRYSYNSYWVTFILVLPVSADATSFDHLFCRLAI